MKEADEQEEEVSFPFVSLLLLLHWVYYEFKLPECFSTQEASSLPEC